LASSIKGGTQTEVVRDQVAEKNILTEEKLSERKMYALK
jgi:hypothetical protein